MLHGILTLQPGRATDKDIHFLLDIAATLKGVEKNLVNEQDYTEEYLVLTTYARNVKITF